MKTPTTKSYSRSLSWLTCILGLSFTSSTLASAKLSVVATTTDIRALVAEVGGEWVDVESIAKGTQDPHFIEAKPSYMTRISHADLVVSVGLDLEVGWLPSLIRGARNPKVNTGNPGSLELGSFIDPLEIPNGKISRAEGDVHPFGNPHFTLDPIRMGTAALKVAERLGQLDPAHSSQFAAKAIGFDIRMKAKVSSWQERIKRSGVTQVVTYHKTLTYFLNRFHLANPAILEPKPGIPPTSGHILEVIQQIKTLKIPLVLVENYFDPTVTHRIKDEVPQIRSMTVPVSVEGAPGIKTLDDLYEALVKAIEGN